MPEEPETKSDKVGNRILVWLTVIGSAITLLGGLPVATYYIGRSVGSNEYILNLPADLKTAKELLEKKIEDAQERDSRAFQTQVKINEDLVKTLNEIRAELQVNNTTDRFQHESIQRLERMVEDLRKIVK